eukprot:203897_1
MSHQFVFVLCSSWFVASQSAALSWTLSSTNLPINIAPRGSPLALSQGSICGHSPTTNELFILTGSNLMSYDLSSKQFTTHSTTLPVFITCEASCYAQFNQYLYFIAYEDSASNGIGVFDMNTRQIQFPLISNQSLNARGSETCLAMSTDGKHLFIVGGRDAHAVGTANPVGTFQIYDIDHGTLVTGPQMIPTLPSDWYAFAPGCAVLGNRLYRLGGWRRYGGSQGTIGYIDVSNI